MYVNNIIIENYLNSSSFDKERNKIKLLLNKNELNKIKKELNDVGITIVATKLFINDNGLAKLEISTAKGKKNYDKREVIKKRENKVKLIELKNLTIYFLTLEQNDNQILKFVFRNSCKVSFFEHLFL